MHLSFTVLLLHISLMMFAVSCEQVNCHHIMFLSGSLTCWIWQLNLFKFAKKNLRMNLAGQGFSHHSPACCGSPVNSDLFVHFRSNYDLCAQIQGSTSTIANVLSSYNFCAICSYFRCSYNGTLRWNHSNNYSETTDNCFLNASKNPNFVFPVKWSWLSQSRILLPT